MNEPTVVSGINADPSEPIAIPGGQAGLEAALNRVAGQFKQSPAAAPPTPAPAPVIAPPPAPGIDSVQGLTAMLASNIYAGLMLCRDRQTSMNTAYAFAGLLVDARHKYADDLSDDELGLLDMFAASIAFVTFSSADYVMSPGVTPDNVWASAREGIREHRLAFKS